jgi:16S rRNA G966 N2-methylase RsmD
MLRDCHVVYILPPYQHEHLKEDANTNVFAESKIYQIDRYFNF